MKPVDIRGRTRAMGAPLNWDYEKDGDCGVLPIRDGVDEHDLTIMTSAWMPCQEELNALANGLPILLTIHGRSHPVVSLGVGTKADLAVTNKVPVHG